MVSIVSSYWPVCQGLRIITKYVCHGVSMKDVHPYPTFVPDGAVRLIIGSIPPHRFCVRGALHPDDVDFFYGSRANGFWKLIGEACGVGFTFRNMEEAVRERKKFLTTSRTGITDIIERCGRANEGSSDADLTDIEFCDPSDLLRAHPDIMEIVCTSTFVKRCLGSALGVRFRTVQGEDRRFTMSYSGKEYLVIVLFSPSPNAVRFIGAGIAEKRRRQYEMTFGHHCP